MNSAHVHLTINHFPVFCVLIGLIVLIIGRIRRSPEITMVALVLFVVAAVVVVPTYFSGRASTRVIRGLPGVVREVTMSHSAAARPSMYLSLILGAVSLWGLRQWRAAGDVSASLQRLTLGLAVVTTGLLLWTAHLGGKVRHTELRPGYVIPTAAPTGAPGAVGTAAP